MTTQVDRVEIGNWKFGLHAFVLLMNVFNLGPSFSTIALYSVAFDSDKTFLLMNFRNHDLVSSSEPFYFTYQSRARPYLITLLPVCRHPTRKLVSSLPNFKFQAVNGTNYINKEAFFCIIS